MMTLFAVPKPFRGHIETIQRNAIASWTSLRPACQIVLIGDDFGTAKVAEEFGLEHVPEVSRNERGTPLVDAVFANADRLARFEVLCYVNADIILDSGFIPAVRRVLEAHSTALAIGRRWDLDVQERLDFDGDWESILTARRAAGRLHAHTGIDYFVFRRGLWPSIPPFAIGRSAWDSWLVYDACARSVPVVDLTPTLTVIHQNHDYSHHANDYDGVWHGSEAKRNRELAGGVAHAYTVLDAPYHLTKDGVRLRRTPYRFYRRLVDRAESSAAWRPVLFAVRAVRRVILPEA
jgi:hypothetical protein